MSAEQPVMPGELQPGFIDRVTDFTTAKQFDKLTRNLEQQGLVSWLGRQAVEGTDSWDTLASITDGLVSAEVLAVDQETHSTKLSLGFNSRESGETFARFYNLLLAGVAPKGDPPFFWPVPGNRSNVIADNFTYPDLSTAGRASSALLRRQYKAVPDIDVIAQANITELSTPEVFGLLPAALQQRVSYQKEKVLPESILSSGHLSLIGLAMRQAIKPHLDGKAKLPIQRPWGQRPAIEEEAYFFSTQSEIPMSRATIGRLLVGQLRERMHELGEPYKKRNFARAVEDFYDIASGLGITQGVGTLVRGLGTLSAASLVALWGATKDRVHSNKQRSMVLS